MRNQPWTMDQKRNALLRGPHKSAKDHATFLQQEFASMLQKQQWTLLPAALVTELQQLRLSPLGVIPQHDRRPRTIADYTFFHVNQDTVPLGPPEAMQFGRSLRRLLTKILYADPRFGPVYLCKIDIADGFYRIWLLPCDIPKLGVLFPTNSGEPPLIGFPLTLPMGWVESPPFFSAATETVADLANQRFTTDLSPPPHRLELVSETVPITPVLAALPLPCPTPTAVPAPRRSRPLGSSHLRTPLAFTDVYVDDFVTLVQGNPRRRCHVKRTLLHTLDSVFRPLAPTDSPHRQEPASVKKFLQGDGTWATTKVVLGWVIDTAASTIHLPPRRLARLHAILASLPRTTRRVATKHWHQVIGELRSMVLAIPGARGLFSTLQTAFQLPLEHGTRLRLNANVHDFLDDFRWLAAELSSRPTRIAETIPTPPSTLGACDAAGAGMGGVFFVPTPDRATYHAFLWRQRFPLPIQRALQSSSNRQGTITNSDLELAATIAQHDVLVHQADVREHTVLNLHDNTPAVFWQRRGSTTTQGPAAYLLRLQALHQRYHRYLPQHDYIPGPANCMADSCSRRWDLSDSQLLSHFNSLYPQSVPWTLCPLRPPLNCALISALSTKRSEPASFLAVPPRPIGIGNNGWRSPPRSTWIPGSTASWTQSPCSRSSPLATATAAWPPATDPFALAQWRTPSAPSARRSPAWGPKMSAKMP